MTKNFIYFMVFSKKGGVSGQNNGKLALTVKNDVRIGRAGYKCPAERRRDGSLQVINL